MPGGQPALALAQIEVNSEGVSICLINDCVDMDVPLLELSLRGNLSIIYIYVYLHIYYICE
mgnify:CR=1 FL=1